MLKANKATEEDKEQMIKLLKKLEVNSADIGN